MRRYLAIIALGLFAPAAQADWFHTLVGYKCNPATDRLVIYYVGAYNEAGEKMVKNRNGQEWEPWSLVTMKDDDHIGDLKTVERTCELPHGKYKLRIGPSPGNANIQGSCGAQMSAWVEVIRDDAIVLTPRSLEGDCHGDDDVLTRITFDKGSQDAKLKFLPKSQFWEFGGLDP
jgi:hypothetical protein